MSQGVLQAIFEYQTVICELTGMDVSNASGYDGTTVAADACFVAKHATGRSRVVLCETLNPQVRQVVKTYAPGFGLDVVEVGHRGGVTDADDLREACTDAACAIFQQPNFFGCLEPAPDLAAAASDAGALAVAHVDPVSLGVLEAPGAYGCALAIGEGQSAGNYQSYGGPHYGFLAARSDLIRRMPGRIVGETTDLRGERGYVLTLQTREQHIRREKATSNITTNQTLLALGGLVHLSWLGPQGLRELGETCMSLAEHAKERLGPSARVSGAGNVQRACRPGRTERAATSCRVRACAASIPAMRSGATTQAWTTRSSSPSPRSGRPRTSTGWPRCCERSRVKLDLREVAAPDAVQARCRATTSPVPDVPAELARRTPPRLPEISEPELVRHFTALADRNFGVDTGFYPLGSCTMKYNPRVNERVVDLPGFRDLHPPPGGRRRSGRARADVAAAGDPGGDQRPARGHRCSRPPAAQGELTGLMLMRAYFADRGEDEQRRVVFIRRHGPRDEPGQRGDGGLRAAEVQTDERGNLDVADLRGKVDDAPRA